MFKEALRKETIAHRHLWTFVALRSLSSVHAVGFVRSEDICFFSQQEEPIDSARVGTIVFESELRIIGAFFSEQELSTS